MEEPLNPKGKTPRIVKTPPKVVEIKRKKHAMSVLDMLLALVTVTPLVISHWRGTWVLMDIYNESFPIWESFFLGVSLHFSFALMKDGLRDLIHRGQKTRMQQVHAFFLRRLYTYLFTCACILHWRAGWVVFDDFFAIELRDDGRAKKGIWGFVVVAATVIFAGVLCAMKSFRNVLTTPFMIGLDTKGTCFNFPTRFQQNILYTTLHALKNNKRPENVRRPPNASSPSAEKIVASQVTVEKQIVEQISPRPFLNDLRGAAPSTFLAPHGTTSDYPQIQNHRQPTHPKNIQDIIEYLSENAHRQKELIKEEQAFANTNRERDRFKVFGRIQGTRASHHHHQQQQQSFTRDPFFAYKPQDPSDINLLAPSSFRFAPAILPSSFYKQRQKLIQEAEALNDRPVENSKNPLKLTLSIYPYGNSNKVKLFQGPGLTPRYRYPSSGTQPGRMIVHLNVYPGPGGKFAVDQENEDRIATGQTESAPHLQ